MRILLIFYFHLKTCILNPFLEEATMIGLEHKFIEYKRNYYCETLQVMNKQERAEQNFLSNSSQIRHHSMLGSTDIVSQLSFVRGHRTKKRALCLSHRLTPLTFKSQSWLNHTNKRVTYWKPFNVCSSRKHKTKN